MSASLVFLNKKTHGLSQQSQVRLLLSAGSDPERCHHATMASPLFIACRHGHLDVVRMLLEVMDAVDQQNATGETPLWKLWLLESGWSGFFLTHDGSMENGIFAYIFS